jgi:hypothetical protein
MRARRDETAQRADETLIYEHNDPNDVRGNAPRALVKFLGVIVGNYWTTCGAVALSAIASMESRVGRTECRSGCALSMPARFQGAPGPVHNDRKTNASLSVPRATTAETKAMLSAMETLLRNQARLNERVALLEAIVLARGSRR